MEGATNGFADKQMNGVGEEPVAGMAHPVDPLELGRGAHWWQFCS